MPFLRSSAEKRKQAPTRNVPRNDIFLRSEDGEDDDGAAMVIAACCFFNRPSGSVVCGTDHRPSYIIPASVFERPSFSSGTLCASGSIFVLVLQVVALQRTRKVSKDHCGLFRLERKISKIEVPSVHHAG